MSPDTSFPPVSETAARRHPALVWIGAVLAVVGLPLALLATAALADLRITGRTTATRVGETAVLSAFALGGLLPLLAGVWLVHRGDPTAWARLARQARVACSVILVGAL